MDTEGPPRAKLLKVLKKQVHDALDSTLIEFLSINGVPKAGKLSRAEIEDQVNQRLEFLDYSQHLPQPIPLTASFVTDVMDPVMTVPVATGMYRITMRKLLKLSIAQLQEQALLMKLDIIDLDEPSIAAEIMLNLKADTVLIRPLTLLLLSKEIAYHYGIRFHVPIRGPRFPSSTVSFTVTPVDMTQSLRLEKPDLIAECENQGIPVTRKETKRQLATRLVVWWTDHPDQMREPFTKPFAAFLSERANDVRAA